MEPSLPKPTPTPEPVETIDWNDGTIILESGKTYYWKEKPIHPVTKDIMVKTTGPEPATIMFGTPNYSQWADGESPIHPRFQFDLGDWKCNVSFQNIHLRNAALVDEAQPFHRALFKNNPTENQSGFIALINCTTDMQLGLFYSGQQEIQQVIYFEKVQFKGFMWTEIKANFGGGILLYGIDSVLQQTKPSTHFSASFSFSQNEVFSSKPFTFIDTIFDGWGNSSNIIYCEGMVFQLRPGLGVNSSVIARIPKVGDKFSMTFNGEFLSSNEVQLQAGDLIELLGKEQEIIARDRMVNPAYQNGNYPQDYKIPDISGLVPGENYLIKVIHSRADRLVGSGRYEGYMIFKYDKHFWTGTNTDLGLDYILQSNPYGVLSYHKRKSRCS
ncbi:hypothetical protein V8V91_08525 [Algoriphagus halophilus]|uniref:hypothetical protein n=1 Tax=Algoriphagus halophilus TaxID=226505 RepID=UPI00358F2692